MCSKIISQMCVFVCVCVCVYVCINKAGQKGDSSSDANIPDEDPFYAHVRATQEQVCPPPQRVMGLLRGDTFK